MAEDPRALSEVRRQLIAEFVALPGEGDVILWQRALAEALVNAELNHEHHEKVLIKHHRHLLRIIGDALVYELLPSHTIRTLGKGPRAAPPGIASQGADFDFVFECAERLRAQGIVPIIADLTTLINTGDVIGWNGSGIVALECKNRPVPERLATSGRLARQRARGEAAEAYLRSSVLEEEGIVRQAVDFDIPDPAWVDLEGAILEADQSQAGFAVRELGKGDVVLVCTARMASVEDLGPAIPDTRDYGTPMMVNLRESLYSSDFRVQPPTAYPLTADYRHRLLEGQILIYRFVDVELLGASFIHDGIRTILSPRFTDDGLYVDVVSPTHRDSASFGPPLTRYALMMPVRLSQMRDAMTAYASRAMIADIEDSTSGPGVAPGDQFTYATAYRPAETLGIR